MIGSVQDCDFDEQDSWWFIQNIYLPTDILRSLKAGGGSGNIPKIIIESEDIDECRKSN